MTEFDFENMTVADALALNAAAEASMGDPTINE